MVAAIATSPPTESRLDRRTMLPDLLAAHPQTRGVLDRYGLSGCGGRLGPVESIEFFARTHGVDESRLMRELQAAIDCPEMADAPETASVADTLYRRFFTAGILLVLTAGATWGAYLLWKIGFAHSFTKNSVHEVNAHGSAQIFGWVGLFIMGFAYQAFARIWHTKLAAPRLAVAVFLAMVVSLIVATTGTALAGQWQHAVAAAAIGNALAVAAVVVFALQIVLTFLRSQAKLDPYVGFVIAALVWFVAMSAMSAWHTHMTMTATTREALLWYVATYQAPLRDLQIHGLALFMILGVSLRMLPPLFGVPQVSDRRAWRALAVLAVAVIGEAVLFVAYRWTGSHVLAAMLLVPWLMLTIGCAMIVLPWRLWRATDESADRSLKFVRGAYAWLAVSLAMLLALPLYQWLSGIAFSHAYYGAIRHAITVGFISLMIMGFAAKVVPTLNGIDTRSLTALWGPFVLVNVGCFLRCSVQTATDFWGSAFWIIGISGTLEVTGLAWWGVGLIRIMRHGKRAAREDESVASRPERIEAEHKVADVLAWFPQTGQVFDRLGFSPLRNPVLRRTVGKVTSIAQAAAHKNLDRGEMLDALNAAIAPTRCSAPEVVTLTVAGRAS